MPVENAPATRAARAEVTRRLIDASLLEVRVMGHVAHFTGVIRTLRTHPNVDLQHEMDVISQNLRGKSDIRDVVWDVTLRS